MFLKLQFIDLSTWLTLIKWCLYGILCLLYTAWRFHIILWDTNTCLCPVLFVGGILVSCHIVCLTSTVGLFCTSEQIGQWIGSHEPSSFVIVCPTTLYTVQLKFHYWICLSPLLFPFTLSLTHIIVENYWREMGLLL